MLTVRGLVSRIHRKVPKGLREARKGKPMPDPTRRANAVKSRLRAAVEHMFGYEKRVDGAHRAHHRPGADETENRLGQPRLQHAPQRLAADQSGGRMTARAAGTTPRGII